MAERETSISWRIKKIWIIIYTIGSMNNYHVIYSFHLVLINSINNFGR